MFGLKMTVWWQLMAAADVAADVAAADDDAAAAILDAKETEGSARRSGSTECRVVSVVGRKHGCLWKKSRGRRDYRCAGGHQRGMMRVPDGLALLEPLGCSAAGTRPGCQ